MKNKIYVLSALCIAASSCSILVGMEKQGSGQLAKLTAPEGTEKRGKSSSPSRHNQHGVMDKIRKLEKSAEMTVHNILHHDVTTEPQIIPTGIDPTGNAIKGDALTMEQQLAAKKKEKRHSRALSLDALDKALITAEKIENAVYNANQKVLTALGNNTMLIEEVIEPMVGKETAQQVGTTIKTMVPQIQQAETNAHNMIKKAETNAHHMIQEAEAKQHKHTSTPTGTGTITPTHVQTQIRQAIPVPTPEQIQQIIAQTPQQVNPPQNNNPEEQPNLTDGKPFYRNPRFIMIGGICFTIAAIIAILHKFDRLPDRLAQIINSMLPQPSSIAKRVHAIFTHTQG